MHRPSTRSPTKPALPTALLSATLSGCAAVDGLPDVDDVPRGKLLALLLVLLVGATVAAQRRGAAGRPAVGLALAGAWTLFWCEALLSVWWITRPPWVTPTPANPDFRTGVDGTTVAADYLPGPPGPTVLVVGDSFAAGQGVAWEETLGARVQAALGTEVRVATQASPGAAFPDLTLRYAVFGASLDPDVVVWVWVLNDLQPEVWSPEAGTLDFISDRRRLPWPLVLGVPRQLARSAAVEEATVRTIASAYASDSEPLAAAAEDFRTLGAALSAREARLVLVIFPLLHHLEAYPFADVHRTIRRLGEAAGAEVLDLAPTFAGRDARTLWVNDNDHHPNAEAHALAAEALVAHLRHGELDGSGPSDCTALPRPESLDAPVLRACEEGTSEALHALEAALANPAAARGLDARGTRHLLRAVAPFRSPGAPPDAG